VPLVVTGSSLYRFMYRPRKASTRSRFGPLVLIEIYVSRPLDFPHVLWFWSGSVEFPGFLYSGSIVQRTRHEKQRAAQLTYAADGTKILFTKTQAGPELTKKQPVQKVPCNAQTKAKAIADGSRDIRVDGLQHHGISTQRTSPRRQAAPPAKCRLPQFAPPEAVNA